MRIVNPTFARAEAVEVQSGGRRSASTTALVLLSNAKPNATELLTGIAGAYSRLSEVSLFSKLDPSRGAPADLLDEVARGGSRALVAIGD
jgi:hypothetical protein